MNTQTSLLACALAGLLPVLLPASVYAAPLPAASPPASAAADTPAVAVVRQFLAARSAGRYDAAYALLSASSQQIIPKAQFAAGNASPFGSDRAMPLILLGIGNLFVDTYNIKGYMFTVIGPDPAKPAVVLVRADRAAVPAMTLRLLTVTDPAAHAPRLDMIGSLERTAPKEFASARERAKRDISVSNLKQLALGIIQYTQDHDEIMPDADKWCDEILPYVKTEAIFRDPSAPAGEKWSYAYNRALSHVSLYQIVAPAQAVMLFESTAGVKNASDTGQSVPVPGRHLGGTDYAQADGHVKWERDGTKLSYRLDGK